MRSIGKSGFRFSKSGFFGFPFSSFDWEIPKRICKTILVNSGLPFANYACAFKSAVLLKRTVNQIQGLLSNPFSDFPKGMADDEIPVHFTHQI